MYVSQRTHTSREERDTYTYIDTNIRIYQHIRFNMPEVFNIQNAALLYECTHISVNDYPANT